jgi:hypothetical protein
LALARSGAIPGLTTGGMLEGSFLAHIYREVQRQALLMSFVDDFRLLAYIFIALSPVVFCMRRPQGGGSVAAH